MVFKASGRCRQRGYGRVGGRIATSEESQAGDLHGEHDDRKDDANGSSSLRFFGASVHTLQVQCLQEAGDLLLAVRLAIAGR